MSEEIVLYTNPMSRGRVVRWMLEEVGCPYRAETLNFGPTMKTAEYLAINPMGKVPALRHGSTVITETAAICAYLADTFPEAGLAPAPGDKARGAYLRWLFFSAGPVESAIVDKSLGFEIPQNKRGMVGYGCYEDAMRVLETETAAHENITGGSFSAADVFLASLLGWGMTRAGAVEKKPAFVKYVERHMSRPAALRAKEKDDAAMPKDHK